MKTIIILIVLLVGASLLLLFILGKNSQKGHAPGLVNGSLIRCSEKPNCVCSEYPEDVDHFIKPLVMQDRIDNNDMTDVMAIIKKLGGIIDVQEDNYLAATFTSQIFGFVDDLEIRKDSAQGIMHFRSASRVGYSDGSVNRKRVELLKKLCGEEIDKAE